MGTITTTKKILDDNLDVAAVHVSLAAKSAALDTIAKRMVVTADYGFTVSAGAPISVSKTRMLSDHPALTAAERTTLRTLVGKVYTYEVDNDPLA